MDNHTSTIIEVQIGFIFESIIERPDLLSKIINDKMNNLFDAIPLTLPIPNDTTLNEIPIVQMKSLDNIFSCNIARGRADFYMKGNGLQQYNDIKQTLDSKTEDFLDILYHDYKPKRIAFITRYFLRDEDATKNISTLFIPNYKKLITGEPLVSTLHYTTLLEHENVSINNFSLIEAAHTTIVGIGNNLTGILLTRDFNSNPERNTPEKLTKEFFKKLIEFGEKNFKLEEIMNILWPTR